MRLTLVIVVVETLQQVERKEREERPKAIKETHTRGSAVVGSPRLTERVSVRKVFSPQMRF